MSKTSLALLSLLALAGCERYVERADFKRERADRTYRTAMNDYQAGRIEQAVAGLKKTCADDPSNASARFQLACLLQDSAKDYLEAYCAFHEYMTQHPSSDKTKLAESRLRVCEMELGKAFAEKHGFNLSEQTKKAVASVQEKLSKTEEARAKLERELAELTVTSRHQAEEIARLKNLMRSTAETDESTSELAEDVKSAKELLDEGDAEEAPVAADSLAEAKGLLDEKDDAVLALPQPANAKAKRAADQQAAKLAREAREREKAEEEAKHEKRPDVYVVQAGDSLYKLGVRFYGKASAWRWILEANKATISTDGRIKAGQKLVLPSL